MSVKVAVVIPFFQRDPGILQRALVSVRQQAARADFKIFLVDDESPSAPEGEIQAACLPDDIPAQIIKIANGGPGAARNVGIDAAHRDHADIIAFLDSDDEWLPNHIDQALRGLSSGASFYFCDNRRVSDDREDEAVTFDANWPGRKDVSAIRTIDKDAHLYEMSAQTAFDEFLKAYLGQTSTIVFKATTHLQARFSPGLRSAGEDHMMWLEMTRASSGVCFSTSANVLCGRGINLYFSAFDWAFPSTRDRLGYLALLHSQMLRRFPLSAEQRTMINARRSDLLGMFGFLVAKQAAKGRFPPADLLKNLLAADPFTVLSLPVSTARALAMSSERRETWANAL